MVLKAVISPFVVCLESLWSCFGVHAGRSPPSSGKWLLCLSAGECHARQSCRGRKCWVIPLLIFVVVFVYLFEQLLMLMG